AANARYDLILMDCQMPDMDGFAATRAIKRRKEGARIPVIGVTADVIASDITRCFEAGMDDYFTKPVRLGTLESILQKWVEEAPPLTPL
ncbi:MAG: response regulator, partial [Alphaproteobacteria bacterium]|nr:response regulator [Alphaproteobacteria bacterium]